MRVAIIHYWLVTMRGGERVLEEICRLLPQADIFTHVHDPAATSGTLRRHEIRQTTIGRLPFARRAYKAYLPLMPAALRRLDLGEYDLVISCEAGPAKGVQVPNGVRHLCYCHSPMRYIWDQYEAYLDGAGMAARLAMPVFADALRRWDRKSAQLPDAILANSEFVSDRIRKYWGRDATVLHPPVDTRAFARPPDVTPGDFYLLAGELVAYKRPELAVEAFSASGKPLVVAGGGPMLDRLKASAGSNVRFLGRVGFGELKRLFASCRALVFPGIEDFGMVPVEVMAAGRPVIAFDAGGARETVVHGVSGWKYDGEGSGGLVTAVDEFEESGLAESGPEPFVTQARIFDTATFRQGFMAALANIGVALPRVGDAA